MSELISTAGQDELRAGGTSPRSELIARLLTLRSRVRRRLAAYGVLAVLAGGVVALLTIITLDWLVWLPPALRAFGTFCFLLGFLGSTWYWVIEPLRARIGIDELAGYLEKHFPELRDRLSSTVNFLASEEVSTSSLMREVVSSTEQMVRETPLEEALSLRPIFARLAAFSGTFIALVLISVLAPEWISVGARRYLQPWGEAQWPRTVAIEPLTGDLTVGIGDTAMVRMRVVRGLSDTLRPVVHLIDARGTQATFALQPESADVFALAIDSVTTDTRYWFEAGDDSTGDASRWIRVVARPEVVEATATLEPPAYARQRTVRVLDLTDGPASGAAGGLATIAIRSSKPVTAGQSGLRLSNDRWLPLSPDENDGTLMFAQVELREDLTFRVELSDEQGFTNRGGSLYAIRVLPDQPPDVVITSPQAVTELTPKGSVPISISARDDFGIQSVALECEGPEKKHSFLIRLPEGFTTEATEGGAAIAVKRTLQGVELEAEPGGVFVCAALAMDNRPGPDGEGQLGRSTPVRLKFIREEEFELWMREELLLVEARLRQVLLEEKGYVDRVEALASADDELLSRLQREDAGSLAANHQRLSRQLRALGRRVEVLSARIEENRPDDTDTFERVRGIGIALHELAAGSVLQTVAHLEQALQKPSIAKQREEVASAQREMSQIIAEVQRILQILSDWGEFHGVVGRTRELLDRQTELMRRTKTTGELLLGKPVEELTTDQVQTLRALERQQEQLADDIEQQLAQMRQLAEQSQEKDPAGADSLDAAVRVGQALDAARHARQAASAIRSNRTAAAGVDQKASVQAIRQMMDALRSKEERELAELRKRLARVEDDVSALIQEQNELRDATIEAGSASPSEEVFADLADRQNLLQRNTRLLGEQMQESDRLAVVGRMVQQAGVPMAAAAKALSEKNTRDAATSQEEAINQLRRSLDEILALVRTSEEEMMLRALNQVEEELVAIREAQQSINASLATLREAVSAAGRLGRSEAREAAKLSRQQSENRRAVDDLLAELSKVPVYAWVLERVSAWMETAQESFDQRRLDDDLTALTDRIIGELGKLIEAIQETRQMPFSEEFVEAQGSGGDGTGASAVTVPTVTELLVLKTMQADINSRTKALAGLDPDTASEAELRQLKSVGEDQAEVRRLADKLMNKGP